MNIQSVENGHENDTSQKRCEVGKRHKEYE